VPRPRFNFTFQSLGEIVFSEMWMRPKVTRLAKESKVEDFEMFGIFQAKEEITSSEGLMPNYFVRSH
jgi:energy-converting hydrogenase A subunit M